MKYPISINDKELEDIKEIGRAMGIDDIHNTYGSIPSIIKFSISLAKQTIKDLSDVIPTLDPTTLEILLSSIKRKKLAQYRKEKKEYKQKVKDLV